MFGCIVFDVKLATFKRVSGLFCHQFDIVIIVTKILGVIIELHDPMLIIFDKIYAGQNKLYVEQNTLYDQGCLCYQTTRQTYSLKTGCLTKPHHPVLVIFQKRFRKYSYFNEL